MLISGSNQFNTSLSEDYRSICGLCVWCMSYES